MTREEIYTSIYTHDVIYRPPQEESCACLEVALGCSWGKCLFCDFAKDRFQIHSMAKIEWNLRMLGRLLVGRSESEAPPDGTEPVGGIADDGPRTSAHPGAQRPASHSGDLRRLR